MTNSTAAPVAETNSGFAGLGIAGQLLANISAAGFAEPKPIQAAAIPPHLAGRDIVAIAQTGSGKTAAFSLPILSKIVGLGTRRLPRTARALILAPTRELAVQIEETIRVAAKGLHISTALVLGGVSRGAQVKRMAQGVDILIATPGRLTDLVREGEVKLHETRWLVLDEADRMLDMGFINDVRKLARATHAQRQTALYSATMPGEIEALAQSLLKDPVQVSVAPQGTTAAEIAQSVHLVGIRQKRQLLARLLAGPDVTSVMIFARTKHGADKVTRNLLADGFEAAVIHGNKSQNARQKALTGFRDGSVPILVATDIAARGIDVPGVSHVINYELPDEAESYVHRIGRTGRNGATGTAITLCDPSENSKLRQVERVIRMRLPIAGDHLADATLGGQPDERKPRPQPHHRADGPARHHGKPAGGQNKGRGQRPAAANDDARRPDGEKKPFRGSRRRRFKGQKQAGRAA